MLQYQRHILRQLLAQILIQHIHGQRVQKLLTQLLILLRRDIHHLVLQRADTLANQNVGIGARVGGKQLLQLQVFLRNQRIKLFFRQAVIAYLRQFAGDCGQVCVEFIAR